MTGTPVDPWFLLESGTTEPALNMALDEALLESATRHDRPVLRFYGWTEPAATFGYFQRHSEIAALTHLRPLIRRPTAGGLVPHDADWTYSVIVPPGHAWYELPACESYRRLHEWLKAAFAAIAVDTELAPERDPTGPGQCFVGAEPQDLLHRDRKIAGAAQRRNRLGLLIQGSIQPPPAGIARELFQQAMQHAAGAGQIEWEPLAHESMVFSRARALAAGKYSRREYNERR